MEAEDALEESPVEAEAPAGGRDFEGLVAALVDGVYVTSVVADFALVVEVFAAVFGDAGAGDLATWPVGGVVGDLPGGEFVAAEDFEHEVPMDVLA